MSYLSEEDNQIIYYYFLSSPGIHPKINPTKIPKIAPDQGLALAPHVLPAHCPRYPNNDPKIAPAVVITNIFKILFFTKLLR